MRKVVDELLRAMQTLACMGGFRIFHFQTRPYEGARDTNVTIHQKRILTVHEIPT